MIYSGTFDPYHTGERDLYLSIGQCKVNICYVIYGNVNKRHDIAYSAVSYTHLDVYKRQLYIPFKFEDGGTRVIHYTPEDYTPKD